jgi:hypothetical protein
MTVFAVLMPAPQPDLVQAIKKAFPKDHLSINDTQWLISTTGTVTELSAKLGIYDATQPTNAPTGSAIIFATSAYFGRAPATIWDWIKAKLEAPPSAA